MHSYFFLYFLNFVRQIVRIKEIFFNLGSWKFELFYATFILSLIHFYDTHRYFPNSETKNLFSQWINVATRTKRRRRWQHGRRRSRRSKRSARSSRKSLELTWQLLNRRWTRLWRSVNFFHPLACIQFSSVIEIAPAKSKDTGIRYRCTSLLFANNARPFSLRSVPCRFMHAVRKSFLAKVPRFMESSNAGRVT